jgi:serine/threonine-protein kinase
MPAGSVQTRIDAQPAGLRLGLRWTCDAADALAHAHANGVFHRDAKPSNLLLDATDHAALCDFGVAEDSFVQLTGNAIYPMLMAPEQNQTGTTARTEVWMLGTLLYRLVLDEYPYPAGARLPPGTSVAPQTQDPQIPAALVHVMRRALAVDPEDRYSTVAEFREALLSVRVVSEFRPQPAPSATRRWEASVPTGIAIVEVVPSAHATFTARLRVDRGSGPRTARSCPARPTARGSLRDARTLLHAVVEGRLL